MQFLSFDLNLIVNPRMTGRERRRADDRCMPVLRPRSFCLSFSFETSFVLPYVIHEYLDGPDEDFSIVAVTFIVSLSLFFLFCCFLEFSFAGLLLRF